MQDPILFCLAADLGSKVVGEWPKDGWVKGWRQIDSSQVLESFAGYNEASELTRGIWSIFRLLQRGISCGDEGSITSAEETIESGPRVL